MTPVVFIELTTTEDGPVWILVSQIEAFGIVLEETHIKTKSDLTYVVKETPEEILKRLEIYNQHV
ncbi:hypothetical protein FGG51_gp070 [Mycobacterium phage Astro]|uniref:Uncharacterized protein n=2 Tax=Fromanvirus astro TaxID=1195075 RepID=I6RTX2_9CAUD|nr:hypothetical protein AVT31_gp071 [Mycobacterium phage Smeadley]YP_009638494.1 hypothetical protein FGG51_gp070 [Mycobacterium phage Astro]AFM54928.1 hypothetical protein ASTRO_36 [Mycobacterium phage Astro]AKQ07604.1 hypothetical protein SEA_SMEADLEY_36 [Mycobacterium phage Smeadley]WNO26722.1 hypothetical protein SEA_GROUNDHOG_35 [Mycobacterium phage Groundhog]